LELHLYLLAEKTTEGFESFFDAKPEARADAWCTDFGRASGSAIDFSECDDDTVIFFFYHSRAAFEFSRPHFRVACAAKFF
jgi:hypothetical protein